MLIDMSSNRPTREEAEEAVRTLIAWAGDDPDRVELLETPKRVVASYEEFFSGYNKNIAQEAGKVFPNTNGYDEMIILKDIILESYCEHHMVPIIGKAHIAYIPDEKIIGLSKLARITDCYAKRLQIQERLVIEIANAIDEITQGLGVAVMIESSHQCLSTRGAYKPGSLMVTYHMMGVFKEERFRKEFFEQIKR
jgi:GTP cyclohydrolase IA